MQSRERRRSFRPAFISGTLDNDQWFDIVLKGQLKQVHGFN